MAAPRLQPAPLPAEESLGPSILDSKMPLIHWLPAATDWEAEVAEDDEGASHDLSVAQLQDLKLLGTSGTQPGATPDSASDEELWSVKDPRVQLCQCTFDLRTQIDLRKLVEPNGIHGTSNFELITSGLQPMAVYRHYRAPCYTAIVYASGKARLHTKCEEAETHALAKKFANRISKTYGPVKFKHFTLRLLTVSAGVGFQIDLAGFVEELQTRGQQHGISVISATESSAQVQLATRQHGAPRKLQVMRVYRDGKMVAVKAPNVVEAVHEMDRLLPWLKRYRIWW